MIRLKLNRSIKFHIRENKVAIFLQSFFISLIFIKKKKLRVESCAFIVSSTIQCLSIYGNRILRATLGLKAHKSLIKADNKAFIEQVASIT